MKWMMPSGVRRTVDNRPVVRMNSLNHVVPCQEIEIQTTVGLYSKIATEPSGWILLTQVVKFSSQQLPPMRLATQAMLRSNPVTRPRHTLMTALMLRWVDSCMNVVLPPMLALLSYDLTPRHVSTIYQTETVKPLIQYSSVQPRQAVRILYHRSKSRQGLCRPTQRADKAT